MERAAVQPTRHWAITDYFQRTFEHISVLSRVLRPRRICDIYDLFTPCINLLTYFTYLPTRTDIVVPGRVDTYIDVNSVSVCVVVTLIRILQTLTEMVGERGMERLSEEFTKLLSAMRQVQTNDLRLTQKCRQLNYDIETNVGRVNAARGMAQEDELENAIRNKAKLRLFSKLKVHLFISIFQIFKITINTYAETYLLKRFSTTKHRRVASTSSGSCAVQNTGAHIERQYND